MNIADYCAPLYDGPMDMRRVRTGYRQPPSPGKYPKGIERRRQILDRTLSVYNKHGFEGTSLRTVGDDLGLTHAALRHYFDTRESLLLEVLDEANRRALAFAEDAEGGAVDFMLRNTDYQMRMPGLLPLWSVMTARAGEPHDLETRAFIGARYEDLRERLILLFDRAREQGALRDGIPSEEAAALVVAACEGLVQQWLLNREVPLRSAMQLLDVLFAPVSRG